MGSHQDWDWGGTGHTETGMSWHELLLRDVAAKNLELKRARLRLAGQHEKRAKAQALAISRSRTCSQFHRACTCDSVNQVDSD